MTYVTSMNIDVPNFSRRDFLWTAAAFTASTALLGCAGHPARSPKAAGAGERRSVVSISNGASRRKNVEEALVAIEDQIMPVLKRRKQWSSSRILSAPITNWLQRTWMRCTEFWTSLDRVSKARL